jgi:hypothetical protein
MGEWKAQLSLGGRQDLRREMEEWACKERRKLGNAGETLLEWGFEQLKATRGIERLLKFRIGKKQNPTCQKSVLATEFGRDPDSEGDSYASEVRAPHN